MTGAGASSRRRLKDAATLARTHGLAPSRAERLRMRHRGDGPPARIPTLDDMAGWPIWPLHEDRKRRTIFALAALLAGRDALSRLVSGASLRSYAAIVGEDMLERVLDWPRAGNASLPAAENLHDTGWALALAELPPSLADAVLPSVSAPTDGAPDASGNWVVEAEKLLTAAGRL